MEKISIYLASIAASCASNLIEAKSHDDASAKLKDAVNVGIVKLHKEKATVGRNGKCAIASAFYDTLIQGGWAKGTAANYLSTFRDAVKSGKPVTDWNPNRKGAKGKSGKGKSKGAKAFADLFRPAFNHDEGKTFMALCADIQARYENAEFDNLYDGFVEFLKSEGDEIAE